MPQYEPAPPIRNIPFPRYIHPAMSDDVIIINPRVRIPYAELQFQFARASGPGGQHVNRTESAVELSFDLAHTPWLTETERARAIDKLGSYVDGTGVVHVVSQSERSQLRNRELAIKRFVELLQQALTIPKKRRPTKPSKAAQEKRMDSKRKAGKTKQGRGRVSLD